MRERRRSPFRQASLDSDIFDAGLVIAAASLLALVSALCGGCQ